MTVIESIVAAVVPYALPLLVSGLTALGALVGRWLHQHAQSSKVLSALTTGADYVGTAVAHVMSGLSADVAMALANDGKIDSAELAAIKTKALALVKAEMPSALKTIADALGPAFETWLSGKVSQAVSLQVGAPVGVTLPQSP